MNNILKERLAVAYNEELLAYDKYKELADIAKNDGDCEISKILKDMACEEKSHHDILGHILGDR